MSPRAPPIKHWLNYESWRHLELERRRASEAAEAAQAQLAKDERAREKTARDESYKLMLERLEEEPPQRGTSAVDEETAEAARRRGLEAQKVWRKHCWREAAGLGSAFTETVDEWRRKRDPSLSLEDEAKARARRHDAIVSSAGGKFALRWYLTRLRRYATLRCWAKRKRAEKKVLTARDSEGVDRELRRKATSQRDRARWRQAEWRHIQKLTGVLKPQRTRLQRKHDLIDKRKEAIQQSHFDAQRELGWTDTIHTKQRTSIEDMRQLSIVLKQRRGGLATSRAVARGS